MEGGSDEVYFHRMPRDAAPPKEPVRSGSRRVPGVAGVIRPITSWESCGHCFCGERYETACASLATR